MERFVFSRLEDFNSNLKPSLVGQAPVNRNRPGEKG